MKFKTGFEFAFFSIVKISFFYFKKKKSCIFANLISTKFANIIFHKISSHMKVSLFQVNCKNLSNLPRSFEVNFFLFLVTGFVPSMLSGGNENSRFDD